MKNKYKQIFTNSVFRYDKQKMAIYKPYLLPPYKLITASELIQSLIKCICEYLYCEKKNAKKKCEEK